MERSEDAWRASLSAMLDGEEPSVPVAELMAHLSECPACSAWLDHVTVVNAGLRSLPVVQPALGDTVVNGVDVALCACRSGGRCLCSDCQCGADCTCHRGELAS
jgi:predicted anti-sigma-YlaC factor YlaD